MLSRTQSHQIQITSDTVDRPCIALNLIKREGSRVAFPWTNKVFCTICPPLLPWVLNLKGKCGNSSAEATGVRVFLVDPHAFQRPTGQTGPKRGVADEPEVTP